MTTLRVLVAGQLRIEEPCGALTDVLRRAISDLVHECRAAKKPCAVLSETDGVTRILARC